MLPLKSTFQSTDFGGSFLFIFNPRCSAINSYPNRRLLDRPHYLDWDLCTLNLIQHDMLLFSEFNSGITASQTNRSHWFCSELLSPCTRSAKHEGTTFNLYSAQRDCTPCYSYSCTTWSPDGPEQSNSKVTLKAPSIFVELQLKVVKGPTFLK